MATESQVPKTSGTGPAFSGFAMQSLISKQTDATCCFSSAKPPAYLPWSLQPGAKQCKSNANFGHFSRSRAAMAQLAEPEQKRRHCQNKWHHFRFVSMRRSLGLMA